MLHACDLLPKHRRGQDRPAFGTDDLWLLLCAAIWGGNAVASKYILLVLSPLDVFYVRLLAMALCFGVPLLLWGGLQRQTRPVPWLTLAVGGLFMAGQNAAFFWGTRLTMASTAALLNSSTPLFTVVLSAACGLESFRRRNWVGLGLSMAGVALVMFGAPYFKGNYAPAPLLGDAVSLLSSVFFALFILTTKRAVEELGALLVLGVGYSVAALVMLPGAFVVLPRVPWETLTAVQWWVLAYPALAAGAFTFMVYFWVIGRASAVRTSLYQYLVPVLAVIAAYFLLHEALHPWQYLGMALALVGIYLARPPRGEVDSHQSTVASGEPSPVP
jgi:drug/metabolite transporter (DMT)-like permease